MSRVSQSPEASDRKCQPVEGGARRIRPPLIACAVALCALAAQGFLSTRSDSLLRAAPSDYSPQTPPPSGQDRDSKREPELRIEASSSSINVCPDTEPRTRVSLRARGVSADCQPRYTWRVTGGRVEGSGADVVWNLAGAPPGRESYEATVTVETGAACGARRRAAATWRVVSGRCPSRVTSWSYAARRGGPPAAAPGLCPNISLCCRATARPGQSDVPFSVEVRGGTPGATPNFSWTVWGGQLTGGQGTNAVSVRAGDAAGRNILAKVEVGGYGTAAPCSATCVTELVAVLAPLRVLVRDSKSGRPVKGAQVSVLGEDGERVFPTDDGGSFERGGFPPREYLVRVSAPDFDQQERRVNLGEPYGGQVVFSLVPVHRQPPPTPTPVVEAAAVPSPSPEGTSPTPEPYVPPPPIEYSCTGCCLFGLNRQDCRLVALVGLALLGVGALSVGAAWSLSGLNGALGNVLSGDEVHCTVFAPFEAPPGDCFLVQAFAHLASQAGLLADRADDADPDARQRGTKRLEEKIERGKRLSFALQMPGLEVDAPTQSLVWCGEVDSVAFNVTVPEDFKPRNLIATVTVAYESVPVGHVSFKFKVAPVSAPVAAQVPAPVPAADAAPCPPPAPSEAPKQTFVRYRKAFISYASEDRAEVLKRVQMLASVKIEFFQDVLDLEPGDRWERMLYKHIDESDVVYLFWSSAAKRSEWVGREIEYAIQRRQASADDGDGKPAIVPVIIEGPPLVPPPKQLEEFHFNDKIVYFIKQEEAARRLRRRSKKASAEAGQN
ncbi:MAG TPA: TIR domain-containing protein [Pyrinomonadaceae bacterium]|nr:TIR domain-containing protein [Pyrinomonadaceae bacterium]